MYTLSVLKEVYPGCVLRIRPRIKNRMTNRLNLDFSIPTNNLRALYLQEYLKDPMFIDRPPTEEELTTMANYVLWGRNPETGRNAVQDKDINIATKHGTWDHTNADITESLNELMEQPTFNEASLKPLTTPAPKTQHTKFSRADALNLAKDTPWLHQAFLDLFQRIDRLDYAINLYELNHNKRTEIRPLLVAKFTPEETDEINEKVSHWNQYKYLKQRHLLVELRREQYTLRDTVSSPILHHGLPHYYESSSIITFGSDVNVLPLGLISDFSKIFKQQDDLVPERFSEEDLRRINKLVWGSGSSSSSSSRSSGSNTAGSRKKCSCIDFTDENTVYQFALMRNDLDLDKDTSLESTTAELIKTFDFYVEFANLEDIYKEIYDQKINQVKNSDIAFYINHKYGKSYTSNYISTIFTKKIVASIANAAVVHKEIVSNLCFPENFKTCTKCGRTYLKDAQFFVRRSRSKDGFANKCKMCEKIERQEKKEAKD